MAAQYMVLMQKRFTVEVNVTQGQRFHISGLPDNAAKESTQCVESAIKIAGYFMLAIPEAATTPTSKMCKVRKT